MDSARGWAIQAAIMAIVLYLYVFMEWLFFVTKPSFMTGLGPLGKLQVLLVTPVPLLAVGFIVLLVFWVPALAVRSRIARRISSAAGSLLAAAVLAALLILLVDNFTFTVMRFGIRTVPGAARYLYVLLFLVLMVFSYRIVDRLMVKCSRPAAWRATVLAAAALIAASAVAAAVSHTKADRLDVNVVPLKSRPNIILLSPDGVSAENMSVYGYQRATTPFLNGMADRMLLCENCFCNSDASFGSIASIFTGKLPTQTRVCYPPEILKGKDAYQHLPGILRRYGYRNIDVSVRHYADPIELNMKDSFDWVNFRRIRTHYISRLLESSFGQKSVFFMRTMRDRLSERLLHAFGVRRMEDPRAEVAAPNMKKLKDAARVKAMFSFIDEEPSAPFFAHLHLLGTHGPMFFPERPVFSAGQVEKSQWMVDFYDDAILDFDRRVRDIAQGLRMRGLLHNTIFIICTDHGQRYVIGTRIPLIFLFPEGEHHGRMEANVQNLDIAPTLLDYLGIEQPEWMAGRSLIAPGVEANRPIFTVGRRRVPSKVMPEGLVLDKLKIGPPFYSIGSVGVIICQNLYLLNLEKGILTISAVKGHTAPCSESDIPSPQEIGQMIINHLVENGYDTSSIRMPLPVREQAP
jgi:arylsulfatase A-like enzyme